MLLLDNDNYIYEYNDNICHRSLLAATYIQVIFVQINNNTIYLNE